MTELATTAPHTPATIGQATAVEQARAEAEVKAAVVVAQQCPRDVPGARAQMIESCQQMELAQRAFFRYRRGTTQITGPTIHMARELARCWGNVQYGIAEMRRDDVAGESEMLAFAWDVQTNTRNTSTFIVPHIRDKQGGGQKLTDVRDIYENNANMGARRVREAIFAILPPWFTEQAKAICNATIERGDGTPLPDRIAKMLDAYARANITKRQLEEKVGLHSDNWTARDVAALTVVWRSLTAGETTRAEEFPSSTPEVPADAPAAQRMAAALPTETGAGSPESEASSPASETEAGHEAAASGDPAADEGAPEGAAQPSGAPAPGAEVVGQGKAPAPRPVSAAQVRMVQSQFGRFEFTGTRDEQRDERLAITSTLVGREVESTNKLTKDEATGLIDTLSSCQSRADLDTMLAGIRDQEAAAQRDDEGGA